VHNPRFHFLVSKRYITRSLEVFILGKEGQEVLDLLEPLDEVEVVNVLLFVLVK
jgi:hypothetical protein